MKKIILLLAIVCTTSFAQNTLVQDSSNQQQTATSEIDSDKVSFKALPFAFYNNLLGWIIGGFGGIKGFAQEDTFAKVGGLVSTAGSYYGYLQIENLQFTFFPRLFFRPDIYVGHPKELALYVNTPKEPSASPGANDTKNSDKVLMEGTDQWHEFTFKFLLPFGHGKKSIIIPKFDHGILVGGETGGTSWNPLKSGRTFLSSKIIYRHTDLSNEYIPYDKKTFAIEFALIHENMDYYFNPTRGSYKKIAFATDWGAISDENKFQTWAFDYRKYIPLYNKDKGEMPLVLALNFMTMDTPTWYDYKLVEGSDGTLEKEYIRPMMFLSSYLGGEKRLRSYTLYRFYDKAMIYYSVELRKTLAWNPLNSFSFTRKIGVDLIELVAFADAGRVAPQWRLKTLHQDVKWSAGGGLRFFMSGLLVRVDLAGGDEGLMSQMFIDHPF